MRKTTRLMALFPAVVLAATACGSGGGSGDEEPVLTFANSYTEDHPHTRCGIDLVAERVAEADAGFSVDTFPNSTLGSNTETFASVMSGDIDMDVQGSAALGSSYEPIGVLDAAYAFRDADHLFGYFDSEASQPLRDGFEEATGVKILDAWYFGDRHFTANEPIRTPGDLAGLRMRFPDSPIYLANAEAMGAEPTTVAFEEVYLALQQGTVDGQENPIPTIAGDNFDEVQSHISLTGHQIGSQMIVVSGQTWNELSADQQEVLQEAVGSVRADNRACIEEAEEEILQEWRAEGSIEVVDDVDVEAFRSQVQEYFAQNLEGEQRELYESFQETE
ncbi:tripartite ATP-independent transporter DctP family solute receptor [Nocardiopsis sp. Huas11]|uniref:sialic acid TRAP transporter substrate-binding protein SiaP n=1 Tax=Nocardiopsis sp. Huas11 TaxID=2183912 RepID=UPI000EAE7AFA|nr:sialic acid TRAP transporter substrate-binding protein SiaP [Nocardiopsis sp. Huas11]RKS08055.1 tripartite ATP-independent transporter DctP family solute receptor [Nocardiopsis sp. Huas11]